MVWVEFLTRMTLAVILVVPAGIALLWAARGWSQTRTAAPHRAFLIDTGPGHIQAERSESGDLVHQLSRGLQHSGAEPQRS
jgi:hypothetical protein